MQPPRKLPVTQAEITAGIDAELDETETRVTPILVDKRDPAFVRFLGSQRRPGKTEALNRIIQAQGAAPRETRPPMFQKLAYEHIDIPDLWSRMDQDRSRSEGWAIGRTIKLPDNAVGGMVKWKWVHGLPRIGRVAGTFVTDEDAEAWVVQQARQSDKWSIYNRALAVVAALAIRDGA